MAAFFSGITKTSPGGSRRHRFFSLVRYVGFIGIQREGALRAGSSFRVLLQCSGASSRARRVHGVLQGFQGMEGELSVGCFFAGQFVCRHCSLLLRRGGELAGGLWRGEEGFLRGVAVVEAWWRGKSWRNFCGGRGQSPRRRGGSGGFSVVKVGLRPGGGAEVVRRGLCRKRGVVFLGGRGCGGVPEVGMMDILLT